MTGRAAMVRSALVLAIGASLVGCAVMRIDVDVYKGPLANHEDVQTQQFAAMAIGAKPLLIRLEATLNERVSTPNKEGDKAGANDAKELKKLLSQIRGLYDPPKNALIASLKEQATAIFTRYAIAKTTLDDAPPSDQLIRKLNVAAADTTTPRGELAAAYRDFLLPPDKEAPRCKDNGKRMPLRNWHAIFQVIRDINDSQNAGVRETLLGGFKPEELPDRCVPIRNSSNGAYLVLRNKKLLHAHASLIFPKDEETQRLFVNGVSEIAESFIEAREALADLLGVVLKGLSLDGQIEIDVDPIQHEIKRNALLDATGSVLGDLLQAKHLRLVLEDKDATPPVRKLRRDLGLPPDFFETPVDEFWLYLKRLKAALKSLVKRDPVSTSLALMEANNRFILSLNLPDANYISKLTTEEFKSDARRRYGLARAPFELDKAAFKQIGRELESAFAELPFDRGRLADGINVLIENYLIAAKEAGLGRLSGNEQITRRLNVVASQKRRALLDALVRFAEKLLFIANHEAIFTPGGGQSDEVRSLVRRYVQVLQAIGNSILIQADELRSREAHETNLKDEDRTRAELQALKKKFPKLGAVQLGNNENARDVLDRLIAALRYEHIEALKNPVQDTGSAKNIAAALKVAYEQRAGMAYIRPSASYLRSSFPATSLQDDPRLAWENMLTGHARRSFSPFGAWLGTEEKLRQTINAEIDKQFWQNINSVRVSGAGATNYVIVKDDIGNWYVKSFSADPESIIKSAQQLAMFNLGGQMGTNLIRQRDLQRKVDSEKATEEDKAELKKLREQGRRGGNGTLDRHFVIRQREYESRTQQDFDNLKAGLEANQIKERIKTAWSANPDTKEFATKLAPRLEFAAGADGPLARALAEMKKSSGNAKADKAAQGVNIVTALQAFGPFHSLLVQQVRAARLSERPAEELKSWEKKKKERDDELAETTKKLRDAEAKRDLAQANLNTEEAKKTEEKPNKPAIDKAKTKLATEKTNVGVAIGNADKAELAAMAARDAVDAARQALKKAKRGEEAAISEVTRIVRDELIKIAARRQDTVKTFETSVTFIGGAASPAPQP